MVAAESAIFAYTDTAILKELSLGLSATGEIGNEPFTMTPKFGRRMASTPHDSGPVTSVAREALSVRLIGL